MLFVIKLNIMVVLLFLGSYQLYLQFTQRRMQRFPEGLIKHLQLFIGIPTLANLIVFAFDPFSRGNEFVSITAELTAVGVIVFNLAALMILWAHVSLGRFWSGDLGTRSDHVLIETGLYRWVRHPLYSSFILLTLGLFLMTGDWLVGLSMLAYFSTVAARTWKEEEMLLSRLGLRYAVYQIQTGRFLPRILVARAALIWPFQKIAAVRTVSVRRRR
jgi:protein-S-isoprenylcysteine O-methyltransferase Ste14